MAANAHGFNRPGGRTGSCSHLRAHQLRGTLELASPDLVVIRDGGGAQRTLRADMVRAIDARRVRPWGQRARRGALVGAAIGFLVPAVTSLAKGEAGVRPTDHLPVLREVVREH